MPSAYGHTNGHHLAAVLTNGQTTTGTPTVAGHRGPGGASAVHHGQQPPPTSQQPQTNEEVGIKEVWAHNLEEEFVRIRKIVQHYPFVAMDTEFPGVVSKPVGQFSSTSDYQYQIMRTNIDLLKIIQIGLTFMNAEGKKPDGFCTWQFNFRFNLNEDMYAMESIELLTNSGIQFNKHDQDGIDPTEFAVLLIGSGVVLSDQISWLSFHSGYDFGYLLKILTDLPLPLKETEFFEVLNIYFPRVYDLKYLMKSTKDLKGGLQEVAEQLTLVRKGPQHQAGSDSLLTGEAFFKLKEMYFENDIEEKRYLGFIYGLETAEPGKAEPEDPESGQGGAAVVAAGNSSNNSSNSSGTTTSQTAGIRTATSAATTSISFLSGARNTVNYSTAPGNSSSTNGSSNNGSNSNNNNNNNGNTADGGVAGTTTTTTSTAGATTITTTVSGDDSTAETTSPSNQTQSSSTNNNNNSSSTTTVTSVVATANTTTTTNTSSSSSSSSPGNGTSVSTILTNMSAAALSASLN